MPMPMPHLSQRVAPRCNVSCQLLSSWLNGLSPGAQNYMKLHEWSAPDPLLVSIMAACNVSSMNYAGT